MIFTKNIFQSIIFLVAQPMQVEGSQKAREWASRCQQLQTEFEYLQTKSEVQSQTLRQAEKKIDVILYIFYNYNVVHIIHYCYCISVYVDNRV